MFPRKIILNENGRKVHLRLHSSVMYGLVACNLDGEINTAQYSEDERIFMS